MSKHWQGCQLDLLSVTAEWEGFFFSSWHCKASAVVFDVSYLRSMKPVYILLNFAREALKHTFTRLDTLMHVHFQTVKTVRNQHFLVSKTDSMQPHCCCKTGQTGSRQVQRHSGRNREWHGAKSSQSDCQGLPGEGKGLTIDRLPVLSSW